MDEPWELLLLSTKSRLPFPFLLCLHLGSFRESQRVKSSLKDHGSTLLFLFTVIRHIKITDRWSEQLIILRQCNVLLKDLGSRHSYGFHLTCTTNPSLKMKYTQTGQCTLRHWVDVDGHVIRHPHGCQDPTFPSWTLHCDKIIIKVFLLSFQKVYHSYRKTRTRVLQHNVG